MMSKATGGASGIRDKARIEAKSSRKDFSGLDDEELMLGQIN